MFHIKKSKPTSSAATDTVVAKFSSLEALVEGFIQQHQLAIVERAVPTGANDFFTALLSSSTFEEVHGNVRKKSSLADISSILDSADIPLKLRKLPFYKEWLRDIATICEVSCALQGKDCVDATIETSRGCIRYHVDMVPQRLLVTYSGQGTEWIPNEAADRDAFLKGKPNPKIILDKSALRWMNPFDVSVFRGGDGNGLLHRTPDSALKSKSLLLRLDEPGFCTRVGLDFDEKTRVYFYNEDGSSDVSVDEYEAPPKKKATAAAKKTVTKKNLVAKKTVTKQSIKKKGPAKRQRAPKRGRGAT